LTATAQQSTAAEFDGRNNNAGPHASGHADRDGRDRKDGQKLTGTFHVQNNSTAIQVIRADGSVA
jgi:hypothetical protein